MKNTANEKGYIYYHDCFIMLITSRFVIRIVDATVQIDNDIALLIILLIVLNVVIGMLSRFLYKKIFRGKS